MPSLNVIEDIFDHKPGRWPSIARIVLAGAIAQIVTLLFMEGSTFWPVVTVIILSSKNVGVTWLRSFQRIIATVIGFFLAVTLVAMFPQSPGALLFSFVPIFLVCIYFSQTVATNPYAFFMVVLTMTVVICPAWTDPHSVVSNGLVRFTETIIGILSVCFVSRCLLPVSAESELRKTMKASLVRTDLRFELLAHVLKGTDPGDLVVEPETRTSFSEKIDLLNAAIGESSHVYQEGGMWVARVNLTNRVAVQTEMLLQQLTPEELKAIPDDFRAKMIECLPLLRSAWHQAGSGLLEGHRSEVDVAAMNKLADELEDARGHGQLARRINAVTTFIMLVRQVAEVDQIMEYQDHARHESRSNQFGLLNIARNQIRNIDRNSLELAVKATLSTMLALIVVATMRWGDAMLTTAVTAILVIQPTMGASWSKSMQRVIGAAIGCAYGIVGLTLISANTNDFTWMLLYASIGLGVSAWLMAGSWETSYVGMQIGIALALVLGAVGPTADVESGLERLTGILVGLCIALAVLRLLWPVWAGSQICSSLSTASRLMADYLEVGLQGSEEEALRRPPNGWNYLILSHVSHAYKYREEARYERGIARAHAAPGLNMGVRLQSLLPKIVLIVEARQVRSLRKEIVSHPAVTALRTAIEDRLRLISNLVLGDEGDAQPLQPFLDRAYEAIEPLQSEATENRAEIINDFLGYYGDMIPELDSLVEDARQTAALFSESKGIPRLASSVS
ncbi:MAG: FUSC family protein [Phycisphaerales bacterium]|nr:FUSC family protein [Phycisphaerales bacterium]